MKTEKQAFLIGLLHALFADRPKQTPADWAVKHVRFDEPGNRGGFSLAGREYMREPLDWWADPLSSDAVLVFGSQTGKTSGIMAGAGWIAANNPARIFWVMPTRDLVFGFSRTRLQPMLRASPEMAKLIPGGARRHDFKTLQMLIGNSIIDLLWSGSDVVSVPAGVVVLDEADRFDTPAQTLSDARDRTKNFANPKRVLTSTPKMFEGVTWQEFLKTDQRRRFLPCPHCGKFVVLIWSKAFSVFKLTGNEAMVKWDREANQPDGTWDLDRVERSARFECPHCAGHIRDAHKTVMDRNGHWQPTAASAARGCKGWHLSSLYASSAECNIGRLSVKFLQAKQSLLGLQGFINGDLAEPYQAQDTLSERVELVGSRIEVTAEWKKLQTVDCQAKAPYFWSVVRAWNGGDSEGIEATSLDQWDDVRALQLKHQVPDVGVVVDSGFGARSESEVYRQCAMFGEFVPRPRGLPMAIGWMPAKGMPGSKRWKHARVDDQGKPSGHVLRPWILVPIDPFMGTAQAQRCELDLFEFAGDFFEDILDALRKGKGGHKWTVSAAMATDEYWRHMDAHVKEPFRNPRTGFVRHEWRLRSKHWPDHLLDCERMQIARANAFGWFTLEEVRDA